MSRPRENDLVTNSDAIQDSLEEPKGIPFEDRKRLGFWKSLYVTWILACRNPETFYDSVGKSHDTASAIYFFLIVNAIASYFTTILFTLSLKSFHWMLQSLVMSLPGAAEGGLESLLVKFVDFSTTHAVVAWLLTILPGLIALTLATHPFLLLMGCGANGISTTLRTLAYASAPNIIPLIGLVWSSVLMIQGLSIAHGAPLWRTVTAVVIQGLVCSLVFLMPIFVLAFYIALHLYS